MNNEKIYKNALIAEKLIKLDKEERKEILEELLKNNTQRGLAEELGIPHSTLHDWVSLRQNNTGNSIHVSYNAFYKKIENAKPEDITDWGRLIMIRDKINELLKQKK